MVKPRRNVALRAFKDGPTARYEIFLEERAGTYFSLPDTRETSPPYKFAAILISPTTLLPGAASLLISDVPRNVVHTLDGGYALSAGFWGAGNTYYSSCRRQHMLPGIKNLTDHEAGFGPLAYYAGALLTVAAPGGGAPCIVSYSNDRSADATRAWDNFEKRFLSERRSFGETEIKNLYIYTDDDRVRASLKMYLEKLFDQKDRNHLFSGTSELSAVTNLRLFERDIRAVDAAFFRMMPEPYQRAFVDAEAEFQADRTPLNFPVNIRVVFSRMSPTDDDPRMTAVEISHEFGIRYSFAYENPNKVFYEDTMEAHVVAQSSGLVVWLNSTLEKELGLDFRPPPPEVIGHMNPTVVSEGWFRAMLRFCAEHSGDPLSYLNTVQETAKRVSPLFTSNSDLGRALYKVQGRFQTEQDRHPLRHPVRRNLNKAPMSISEWSEMAALFEEG